MARVNTTSVIRTVGLTSVEVLVEDAKREWMYFQNRGPGDIHLIPGDGPATTNDKIIEAGCSYEPFNPIINNMQAIATQAGTSLVIWTGKKDPLEGS